MTDVVKYLQYFFATFYYYNCGKFNTFLFLARPCFALSLVIAYASVLHTRVFANVGSKEEFVAHTQGSSLR